MARTYKHVNPLAVSIVASAVEIYGANHAVDRAKNGLTLHVRSAFEACKDNASFLSFFGSGGNNKLVGFVAGELFETMAERISGFDKTKQAKIKGIIKTRAKEARAVRNAGKLLTPDTDLQKLYNEVLASTKSANPPESIEPEVQASGGTDWAAIARGASIEEMANMVSIFVATHPTAVSGLAAALQDCMPITLKRIRKAS